MPQIRLWKLGSLEHKIYPSKDAVKKLENILKECDVKKDLDVIWGPDLSIEIFVTSGDNDKDVIVVYSDEE